MLIFSSTRSHSLIAIAVTAIGAMLGCSPADGPKRHVVAGIVSVDGTPAEGMLVQLMRQDSGTGNDQYPSCISDANGKFQFGGNSTSLGLVEGNYVATFAWLEGKDLEARDKFQGKFSDAKKSSFQLTVPNNNLTEIKFDLKRPN